MKVAIVTNAVYPGGEPEYISITDKLKHIYCQAHSMDYLRTSENPYPRNPPHWAKLPCMLKALEDHDWAIWMDCDAAPVNETLDIGLFLDSCGDRVVMGKDRNGWNCGVFAVSAGKAGVAWLKYINAQHAVPRYQRGWPEQQAMMDSFAGDWAYIATEPPKELGWNTYLPVHPMTINRFARDSWCLHMPSTNQRGVREAVFSLCLAGERDPDVLMDTRMSAASVQPLGRCASDLLEQKDESSDSNQCRI